MDEEERTLYYGIIVALMVGIVSASAVLLKTNPPPQEFSELYFYFERVDLYNGTGVFQGCTLQVSTSIWIDLNRNSVTEDGETFLKGDTFLLDGQFWNISDVAKDSSQILFGKFPKDVSPEMINFSFVIANHLQSDHSYEYTISYDGSTYKETVFIKREEKEVISQSVLIVKAGEYKVTITIDTGEEIYFYLHVKE